MLARRSLSSSITTVRSLCLAAAITWAISANAPVEARAQDASGEVAKPPTGERAWITAFCKESPARARALAIRREGRVAIDAADVLPNPTALVEHNRSFTGAEDAETIAGVTVPLGIGGRRFVLSDAAEERAAERAASGDAALIDAALDLREALVRASAETDRARTMAAQHASLLELGKTLEGLAKQGERSSQQILRQGLEVEAHDARLRLQRARAASATARLARFTGAGPPVDIPSLQDLTRRASVPMQAANPRLRGLDAAMRAADLEEEAADRRWVPDLELFVGYRGVTALASESGHGMAFRILVPISFFDHGQAEASAARAAYERAQAERAALLAEQRAEAAASDSALATLASTPDREEALRRSRDLLERTKRLYLADEASLSDLLGASALTESLEIARIDEAEERALLRTAKMRAAGSLEDPALDRACTTEEP